jgi:hypothetical protein
MKTNYLLKLADYLEIAVERKNFDLGMWECGTKMCAAGYAAVIFKKLGFRLVSGSPYYKGWEGYKAIEHFFEIGEDKAEYLFAASSYDSSTNKREVIKRIRGLANSKKV